MITKKQKLLAVLLEENADCFTTEHAAEKMNMQRSNASALLNFLVSDGILLKDSGRPVRYRFSEEYLLKVKSSFTAMTGSEGTLSKVIGVAESAAIRKGSPRHIVISSFRGSGASTFSHALYSFCLQKNLVDQKTRFIKISFDYYRDSLDQLKKYLGSNLLKSEVQQAFVLFDHIHSIQRKDLTILYDLITWANGKDVVFIYTYWDEKGAYLKDYLDRMTVQIDLPSFENYTGKEQLDYLISCLKEEAHARRMNIVCYGETAKILLCMAMEHNFKQFHQDLNIICSRISLTETDAITLKPESLSNQSPGFSSGYIAHMGDLNSLISNDQALIVSADGSVSCMNITNQSQLGANFALPVITKKMTYEEVLYETFIMMIHTGDQKSAVDEGLKTTVNSLLREEHIVVPEAAYQAILYCLMNLIFKSGNTVSFSQSVIKTIMDLKPYYAKARKLTDALTSQYILPAGTVELLTLLLARPWDTPDRPAVILSFENHAIATELCRQCNSVMNTNRFVSFDVSDQQLSSVINDFNDNTLVISDRSDINKYLPEGTTVLNYSIVKELCRRTAEYDIKGRLENTAGVHSALCIVLYTSDESAAAGIISYLHRQKVCQFEMVTMPCDHHLERNISSMQNMYDHITVIARHDPAVHGITYVPVSKLFSTAKDKLELLLWTGGESIATNETAAYNRIINDLSQKEPGLDVSFLKGKLPALIEMFALNYGLDHEAEVQLYYEVCHITAELLNGIQSDISTLPDLPKKLDNDLLDMLKPLEKYYRIHFSVQDRKRIGKLLRS